LAEATPSNGVDFLGNFTRASKDHEHQPRGTRIMKINHGRPLTMRMLDRLYSGHPAKLVEDSVRYDGPDGQTEIAYVAEDDAPAIFTVPPVLLDEDEDGDD
jgi:hypothetical protein